MAAAERKAAFKRFEKNLAKLEATTDLNELVALIDDLADDATEIADDFEEMADSFTNEGQEANWLQNNGDKMDSWTDVRDALDQIRPVEIPNEFREGLEFETEQDFLDAIHNDLADAVANYESL